MERWDDDAWRAPAAAGASVEQWSRSIVTVLRRGDDCRREDVGLGARRSSTAGAGMGRARLQSPARSGEHRVAPA
jgi:hypothetical protein